MSGHSQKAFSLKLLAVMLVMLLVGINQGLACSYMLDENAEKNILISHAVSNSELSLTQVSNISLEGYTRGLEGEGGLGSCQEYLVQRARVSFTHKKSVVESCSYAVTVTLKYYMGEGFPDGPIMEVLFSDGEAACSISQVRLPKKIILKKRRIIPFPFQQ